MRHSATMNLRLALLGGAAALSLMGPAAAQSPTPTPTPAPVEPALGAEPTYDEDAAEVEALIVIASAKQPGSVIGDIPPELQFTPRDINALGVSSVSELISALSTQLTTGQSREAGGRPVILVNGVRVSSFREIRDVPSEAILRADILPEEVALKYGYPADTRVMNLVLRPRFRATTVEGGYKFSTEVEGGDLADARVNLFSVLDASRLLIDAKVTGQSDLIESDVELAQPRSDAAFRTLTPRETTSSLNVVVSRKITDGLSGTLNGALENSNSRSRLGLNALSTGSALQRENNSVTGHIGGGLNGAISTWRWTATANADRSDSESATQRVINGVGYTDTTNAVSTSYDGEFVINGTAFRVPAGAVSTTLTAAAASLNFKTQSLRANVRADGELSRDTLTAKVNIDVPLFKRGRVGPEILGDVSLNLNAATQELSDFGRLNTVGAGLNWAPVSKLRFIASYTAEDGPPTVQQVGNPVQVTPGVQAYDFTRGETAIISRIEGGNTALKADSRQVVKLGMNLKPFDELDLNFQANYVYTHIDDVIASFPTATSQIEAAFAERFTRDASGRLTSIDARPVNFDERTTEQLRYGFSFRRPFGPQAPARPAGGGQRGAAAPAGQPAAPGAAPAAGVGGPPAGGAVRGPGGGGGRGGFGGGPGGGGGTMQLSLFHTVKFQDVITIRPGVPKLDLLDGAAIGNGGGVARNQLDLQGNINRRGLGANINLRWTEGTEIRGSGATGSQDLTFSDLTTVNLRFFAELRQQPWFREHAFFRGARAQLAIDNLFDQKQDVRTTEGIIPQTYQPNYLDPEGRTIRLSFRKLLGVPGAAVAPPAGGFRGGGGFGGPPGGGG